MRRFILTFCVAATSAYAQLATNTLATNTFRIPAPGMQGDRHQVVLISGAKPETVAFRVTVKYHVGSVALSVSTITNREPKYIGLMSVPLDGVALVPLPTDAFVDSVPVEELGSLGITEFITASH